MFFEIVGRITEIEIIATGKEIREEPEITKAVRGRRWRKLKGSVAVKLADGTICEAEIHRYEAHGVGAKEFKIKRIMQEETETESAG